jgi:hypothetical protein
MSHARKMMSSAKKEATAMAAIFSFLRIRVWARN